jgi:protein-arginine kinase
MSLLARYLDDGLKAELSRRVTSGGVLLSDVIRSGLCHPDSSIGVYAPDFQSYEVFSELFQPILQNFQAMPLPNQKDLDCLNPAAVVSTRIRVARNLAGHAFTAGMSRSERLKVEAKITRACSALAPEFQGWIRKLQDVASQKLDTLIAGRLAFGSDDKYMAAAEIHSDWPIGRSVFNTRKKQLSIWANEEDHLRVAVVMPGACVSACARVMALAMARLEVHLDFCKDVQLGYLTSCPSNVGSAMRVSCMMDLRLDTSQASLLERLESAGLIQIRGAAGEHSPRSNGLVDVSFHNRVGISEIQMQQDMEMLFSGNA